MEIDIGGNLPIDEDDAAGKNDLHKTECGVDEEEVENVEEEEKVVESSDARAEVDPVLDGRIHCRRNNFLNDESRKAFLNRFERGDDVLFGQIHF